MAELFIVKAEHQPCLNKGVVFSRREASMAIMNNKSCMSQEVHVRFCERLKVKFPRSTRP